MDDLLPVRGLCIPAPKAAQLDRFIHFVDEELSKLQVNLLILRVGYNYQFQSRPEFANEDGLSKTDVKKIVAICQKHNIRIIPLINLLGHQSWHGNLGKLLTLYPQFDETPHISFAPTRQI